MHCGGDAPIQAEVVVVTSKPRMVLLLLEIVVKEVTSQMVMMGEKGCSQGSCC